MRFDTLADWIQHITFVHVKDIEMGLDRVREVAGKLNLLNPTCPVITVAGTNGKGSCIAGLEAMYMAQGYQVGAFTTPYLIRINEEIRIQGKDVDDKTLCESFDRIETARGNIPLTHFEFMTLAALDLFGRSNLDVYLLEVGLGGRLDAVNILDADAALITSIALDHMDYLGDSREQIAVEKAGIFRKGRPAICGDAHPPEPLLQFVKDNGVPFYYQGHDFKYIQHENNWEWETQIPPAIHLKNLPLPSLSYDNMATVLMTIHLLQDKLKVEEASIIKALQNVKLPGRMEVFPGIVTRVFDVSHNPAAAELLAKKLKTLPRKGRTYAVFSMLSDKDIVGTIDIMKGLIDAWYIAQLPTKRAASLPMLQTAFQKAKAKTVIPYSDISKAYQAAIDDAVQDDTVVVFGSFHTVADVINHMLH